MRTAGMVLLVVMAGLAGCTDDDAGPEVVTDEDPFEASENEDLQDVKLGPHSGLPSERPADWEPSLDEPPQWVLGEWWTVEITDHFVGETTTVTRIVAGKEGTDYLVGMPLDEFDDEVMILHFPGFGLVKSSTLGYEAHDFLFEPLQFPLEPGTTWQSLWQAGEPAGVMTHQVDSRDDMAGTATVIAGGPQNLTVTYDAEVGAITEFLAPGYMEYRVIDHGFGYEGMVRVPHSHDLLFLNGQLGPAPVPTEATPVTQTVSIPDEYDRTSFSLIIFELAPLLAPEPAGSTSTTVGNGVYQIDVTSPDGETFSNQKLPTEGGHKLASFNHDVVGGDWAIQTVAGGPAQVFMEGIGYLTFDVSLPDGCVVVTERVHDHEGECGGHVHGIE